MEKKARVRLTDEARDTLHGVRQTLQGASPPVRRAPLLRQAQAAGPPWTEQARAAAVSCRTTTGEKLRPRLVPVGCARPLYGAQPPPPPRPKRREGAPAAQRVQAGAAPPGGVHGAWRWGAAPGGARALVAAVRPAPLRQRRQKTVGRHARGRPGCARRPPAAPGWRAWHTW